MQSVLFSSKKSTYFLTGFQSNICRYIFSNERISSIWFKGTLSGPTQFLAAESSLKTMKNAFYFTLKAFFVLKIFKFWS